MCRRSLIILGNGGHAKVLLDILTSQGVEIIGYAAPIEEKNPFKIPYIGNDESVLKYPSKEVKLVNAVGSVADISNRKSIYDYFKSKGYTFDRVIHPSAIISPWAELKEGVQIMAGAIIQAGCVIGNNSIVNTRVSVDHDTSIGEHVHLAPGVILSGGVQIGTGTHIGTGATVIQNVRIGENCVIGAGAVVIRDVEDNKKVIGVPARETR